MIKIARIVFSFDTNTNVIEQLKTVGQMMEKEINVNKLTAVYAVSNIKHREVLTHEYKLDDELYCVERVRTEDDNLITYRVDFLTGDVTILEGTPTDTDFVMMSVSYIPVLN